jgi:2-hydroxy-6-oxonona-2,4-dienedioate hydrolase
MKIHSSVWTDLESVSFRQQWIDVNHVRTRFLSSGSEAEHPSLIFLHGAGGYAEAYSRNLGPHSRHFRTYALDMIGHGWTDKPDVRMEIPVYVDHLVRFLDAMKIERAHISGESLGGWVAAKFALMHPDRLDRLVLNSTCGSVVQPEVMDQFGQLFQKAAETPTWDAVKAMLEWSMADPERVTDDLIAIRQAIYSSAGFKEAMKNVFVLQDMDIRKRNLLSTEDWNSIKAPTLVVWTTHNVANPMREGHRISIMIPGASLVVMDNCGNWPQFEDAQKFNSFHIDFLMDQARAAI